MIKKLNHIAIIVEDIEQALIPYQGLGLKLAKIEFVESYNVRIAFIPIGDTQLELIQPLGKEDDLAKFLRNGGGLHHLAMEVEDLEKVINDIEDHGIKMKDKTPKQGAHNASIAFSEKTSFNGVIIEFIQPSKNIHS